MMTNTAKHTTTPKPSAPNVQYQAAFQRLEQTAACWRAVADLLIPEKDLHIVGRQDFAALAKLLTHEHPAGCEEDSAELRLESLCACWGAVAGLLGEDALSSETRDRVAWLGLFIAREQDEALRALDAASQGAQS